MKNILTKKGLAYLRHFLMMVAVALTLTACDNPEKSDLDAISQVMTQSKLGKEYGQLQQRLTKVTSEAEVFMLLDEMAGLMKQLPSELDGLSLKTDEGKSIRDKLSEGISRMTTVFEKAREISLAPMQKQLAWQQEMQEAQQIFVQALTEFADLAKKEGIELDTSMLPAVQ